MHYIIHNNNTYNNVILLFTLRFKRTVRVIIDEIIIVGLATRRPIIVSLMVIPHVVRIVEANHVFTVGSFENRDSRGQHSGDDLRQTLSGCVYSFSFVPNRLTYYIYIYTHNTAHFNIILQHTPFCVVRVVRVIPLMIIINNKKNCSCGLEWKNHVCA